MRLNFNKVFAELVETAEMVPTDTECAAIENTLRGDPQDYEKARTLLLEELSAAGCTPMVEPAHPDEAIRTRRITNSLGEVTEMRFLTISPAAPEALLTCIAIALTIVGIMAAPLMAGVGLGVSGVSAGILIWKSRKNETDPDRLRIYDAIGRVASAKARATGREGRRLQDIYPTFEELQAETGIPASVLEQALAVLIEKGLIKEHENAGHRTYWYRF